MFQQSSFKKKRKKEKNPINNVAYSIDLNTHPFFHGNAQRNFQRSIMNILSTFYANRYVILRYELNIKNGPFYYLRDNIINLDILFLLCDFEEIPKQGLKYVTSF